MMIFCLEPHTPLVTKGTKSVVEQTPHWQVIDIHNIIVVFTLKVGQEGGANNASLG